jgi:Bifunctional DNA primase/polymerase, N-terminal.
MKETKLIAPPLPFVEAAQWGASFGLRVFPLTPKDKKPLRGFKWRTDATKDTAKIAALWTKYPDANIAWCTGDDSGCFAIDVDGDEGERQFETLQKELGRLPDTVTVLTPGKKDKGPGKHLLFKYPENEIKGRNGIVSNIDIKSDRGYCVLPPSVHPDGTGTYCFAAGKAFGEIDVADCPQVWLDFIRDNKQNKSNTVRKADCCDQ